MTTAAYFNCHGEPLRLSAKDAVLAREPLAYAASDEYELFGGGRTTIWDVRRSRTDGKRRWTDKSLGFGANEESAWRNTLSRMRITDQEEDAKA
jgi:hypothetical protein